LARRAAAPKLAVHHAACGLKMPGQSNLSFLVNRWLLSYSWRATIVQYFLFVALFAIYDLTILYVERSAPNGVSLVNYVVRDDRTDESAMYMSTIRKLADGQYRSTDPYLVEHHNDASIRPKVPVWIGFLLYELGGGTNGGVVLLHTLIPAAGALLLMRLCSVFVAPSIALAITVASVCGIVFATNQYLEWLRLIDVPGPFTYNPEWHLFGGIVDHMHYNRFFSPGITLPLLLVGLIPLTYDVDLRCRSSRAVMGLCLGLQLYSYPHGIIFLGAVAIVAVGLGVCAEPGSCKNAKLWEAGKRLAGLAGWFTIAAIPYVFQSARFHHLAASGDIIARVGLADECANSVRVPVFIWLGVAVIFKICAGRAAGSTSWINISDGRDRLWLSLIIASGSSIWLAGMLGYWSHFPQPWLLPLRIVSYFVPLLVVYPATQWFKAARAPWSTSRWLARSMKAATVAYCALVAFAEFSAAKTNARQYELTEEMARFRDAIQSTSSANSVIMTDNLRLAAWLVCETDRNSFIGYGASSNASNVEMIERFMIPSIIVGRSFEDFYRTQYLGSNGLPDGPSGEHWALHHGSTALKNIFTDNRLKKTYERLEAMSPEALLRRYRVDFIYSRSEQISRRFSPFIDPTGSEAMQQVVQSAKRSDGRMASGPDTTNASSRPR
jgi:hypothetical protein